MWLLSTKSPKLCFFADPSTVEGGYAILSHTWELDGEITFQEIISLCQNNPTEYPLHDGFRKIRSCCLRAQSEGFAWVWIDTCCIDKTSSAELSEAINSMFLWYAGAEVCYAYLKDVPGDCHLEAPNSSFRKAKWHTRGWTLQELLAPTLVVFISQDWGQTFGTKQELSPLLSEITGIAQPFLTGQSPFHSASVAERMSWASRRITTRLEDEAYCLLGLFYINMPVIYGEGRRTFQRLQEEIMKQSYDTSLFAWGDTLDTPIFGSREPISLQDMTIQFHNPANYNVFLFASSPMDFRATPVYFTPKRELPLQPYLPSQTRRPKSSMAGPFGAFELPSFYLTGYGVRCHLPIVEIGSITIAVLLCETPEEHVGLLLHLAPENECQDSSKPKYYTSYAFRVPGNKIGHTNRLVSLGRNLYKLRFDGKIVKPRWRDIYIQHRPSIEDDSALHLLTSGLDRIPSPPFRIARWVMNSISTIGFVPQKMASLELPFLAVVVFRHPNAYEGIRLCLGLCPKTEKPVHWAWAQPLNKENWGFEWELDHQHDCGIHHVDTWSEDGMAFGDAERSVWLAFAPCRYAPETTRILRFKLAGSVYEGMRERTHTRDSPKGFGLTETDNPYPLFHHPPTSDTNVVSYPNGASQSGFGGLANEPRSPNNPPSQPNFTVANDTPGQAQRASETHPRLGHIDTQFAHASAPLRGHFLHSLREVGRTVLVGSRRVGRAALKFGGLR